MVRFNSSYFDSLEQMTPTLSHVVTTCNITTWESTCLLWLRGTYWYWVDVSVVVWYRDYRDGGAMQVNREGFASQH
jgi:hypothetical protein